LGEQASTQQKDEEITFQVTKVVTYKYDYPMTENELWDARQDALNEPNRFMTMWCNENDAKHHYKLYEFIRKNGGWDEFEMVEICKLSDPYYPWHSR